MCEDSRVLEAIATVLLVVFALVCYLHEPFYIKLTGGVLVGLIIIINIIDYFESKVDKK